MTTALVTGGTGLIGSNLADRLLAEDYRVIAVDDLSTGRIANFVEARAYGKAYTFFNMDVRVESLLPLFERHRPDVVFHLAAQAGVRPSLADPIHDASVNIVGSLNLLRCAAKVEPRKVVYAASGGTLYGEPKHLPVKESAAQGSHPMSPYGISKKVVLDYLGFFHRYHGIDFTACALANVYGPRAGPARGRGHRRVRVEDARRRDAHDLRRREPDPRLCVRRRRRARLRRAAVQAKEDDSDPDVVLPEGETIAFDGSGRNGGFCMATLIHGIANGLRRFPHELEAVETEANADFHGLRETVRRYGIDCDWTESGEVAVAREPHELAWAREEAEELTRFGYDGVVLDRDAIRAEVDSPTYLGPSGNGRDAGWSIRRASHGACAKPRCASAPASTSARR